MTSGNPTVTTPSEPKAVDIRSKKDSYPPIYVISLTDDRERRSQFIQQFPEHRHRIQFLDAIDGRYFDTSTSLLETFDAQRAFRYYMAPQQVACALSHLNAWNTFLESGSTSCIIFEDDAIGNDDKLSRAVDIMQLLPRDFFLHLGGQQGLRNNRHLYGRAIKPEIELYHVPGIMIRFMTRACCYALTPTISRHLISRQMTRLDQVDKWDRHLRPVPGVYFTPLFEHPADDDRSHIHQGRERFKRGILGTVLRDGIGETVARNVLKLAMPPISHVLGYTRIHTTTQKR